MSSNEGRRNHRILFPLTDVSLARRGRSETRVFPWRRRFDRVVFVDSRRDSLVSDESKTGPFRSNTRETVNTRSISWKTSSGLFLSTVRVTVTKRRGSARSGITKRNTLTGTLKLIGVRSRPGAH